METSQRIIYWIARILAAVILLQTLYFKFSGSEESRYIFTTVGMEPWGRYAVGIFELLSGALLLINRTAWLGAGLALGLMAGAISMHLTKLGIVVLDDGGYLFFLAIVVTVCSSYVLVTDRQKVFTVLKRFSFS